MKSQPAQIYEKYRMGDPVTDEEIRTGIAHFQLLADLLSLSGEAFRIHAGECYRIVNTLEGYQRARKSK